MYYFTFLGIDIFGFKGHRLFGIKGFTKPELYKLDAGEYSERIQQRFPVLKYALILILLLPLIVQLFLFFILYK